MSGKELGDLPAPMTEEHITRVTVGGPPKQLNGQVALSEYDPSWSGLFAREAKRIKSALGDDALLIEHVGSTSVPGLPAKPIIDILLVVADSTNEESYVPSLGAAGYVLRIRELDWHQHRMFNGPDTEIHLHVFTREDGEIERMLLFRDRLRENEVDRELYASTKRELARKNWKYVQNYADAKSKVVETIIARARSTRRKG